MAQDGTTAGGASYTLDNVTFPVGRTKLQSIFDAIRSTNIGNTAPDLVAGQFWIDNNTPSTTVWTMYLYDGTDSIQFATIDTINNTVNFIDSTFDLINDTTPQLGGTLDANGNDIDMGTNTITDTKVGQWDTAYSWGDHSTQGYLTSETDSQTLSFSNPNLSISNGNSVDLSALSSGISNVVEDLTPQLGGNLDTNGNDINFGDNDKAQFGDSNDLQIYHDGSNSYIQDNGTGNLSIDATQLQFRNGAQSQTYADFANGGASRLFYGGAVKISTTTSGVSVTGTVVSDGLTVDNGASQTDIQIESDVASNIKMSVSSTDYFRIYTSPSDTQIRNLTANPMIFNTTDTERMRIDASGHIGVGTSTLPRTLNIYGASNGTIGLDNPVSGTPQIAFKQNGTDKAFVSYWDAFDTLALSDGSGNGLHFKPSTGNVGINTSSPSAKLEVNGDVLIPEATLTDGATISWDVSTSPVAKVTLGGNRTISAPSNSAGAGQFISLLVIQDGTGSRTLTWNAVYEFASDTAPTLTTTGGKGDLFVFRYNGTKWLEVGRNLNLTLS
jgi:hypothetical protein